jgi:hypothetical protein
VEPIAYYSSGYYYWDWGTYSVTGRRLVAVAIKYR